jgi:hypothetical protein
MTRKIIDNQIITFYDYFFLFFSIWISEIKDYYLEMNRERKIAVWRKRSLLK